MKEEINKLNFGNKNIGEEIEQFWLKGPLKISAVEQCKLLTKLAKMNYHTLKIFKSKLKK